MKKDFSLEQMLKENLEGQVKNNEKAYFTAIELEDSPEPEFVIASHVVHDNPDFRLGGDGEQHLYIFGNGLIFIDDNEEDDATMRFNRFILNNEVSAEFSVQISHDEELGIGRWVAVADCGTDIDKCAALYRQVMEAMYEIAKDSPLYNDTNLWCHNAEDLFLLYNVDSDAVRKCKKSIAEASSTEELRERLLETEQEIKDIVGESPIAFSWNPDNHDKLDTVSELLTCRGMLLNAMFAATQEEVALFEKKNSLLDELTDKMYKRTASLYRTMIANGKDKEWDDRYDIYGELSNRVTYYCEGLEVLGVSELDNDEYYGSDFPYMLSLLNLKRDEWISDVEHPILSCSILDDENHTAEMTDEELGCKYDAKNWYGYKSLNHPSLEHIKICRAVKAIICDLNYSIPDLLRTYDFFVEVNAKVKHFATLHEGKTNNE